MATITLEPLAPKDAIKWWRARSLAASFNYKDLWEASANNAFAVAGVTQLDLIADFQDELTRAMQEGMAFEEFQANAEKILRYRGWWGEKEITDPITGKTRQVNISTASRLENIYRTNIGQALSQGHYQQIDQVAADRLSSGGGMTYLKYNAGGLGARTCNTCADLNGTIRPYNDPIWSYATPCLHNRCRCFITSLSSDDMHDFKYSVSPSRDLDIREYENDRTGYRVKALNGAQPGFGRRDWDAEVQRYYQANLAAASAANRAAIQQQAKDYTGK